MPEARFVARMPSMAPRLVVLEAVRRGARTVTAVAAVLGVTDNAVRGHLAALERDGLVGGDGVVRSGQPGKPAVEYVVTSQAEVELSRAYAPALEALVMSLASRLEPRALQAALADAGRRLAPPGLPSGSTVAARTEAAATLLESLGGSVTAISHARHGDIDGHGCPLGMAVASVPETCVLVQEMLSEQCGRGVEMRCVHGARPHCRFRVS